MSPKGRNAPRDGLVKIGWVVYSLLFPCIFGLSKLLMPFFSPMLRYQLGARFYNFRSSLKILILNNYFCDGNNDYHFNASIIFEFVSALNF